MRRSLLLAGLVLPPLLASPAPAQQPPAQQPPAQQTPVQATAQDTAGVVRVRGGQHPDRSRVVLHLGGIPSYSLRRVGQDHELRLQGRYRLDISTLRRLRELKNAEIRQDGEDTVLLLRPACDCTAESGVVDGMLFVDLRPASNAAAASPPSSPPSATREPAATRETTQIAAARKRLLDDAVRLGLMNAEQAKAMLQGAGQPPAAPVPAAPAPAPAPSARPPADDLASLREGMLGRLALLNRVQAPVVPAAAPRAGSAAPLPNPSFATPDETPSRPACLEPGFTLQGWGGGEGSFVDQLTARRSALALSDQGAAETASLAEFYALNELTREALAVLSLPLQEQPTGALRERLERVRDVARLLGREAVSPGSPLLAEAADCARQDLPLWRALVAAVSGDPTTLAKLAPQARAALRDIPADLRLAFVVIMAETVEEDAETLRTLLAAIRTGPELRPDQQAQRSMLMAKLARLEGNRADETLHLDRAARSGRNVPAIQARMRLAALNLSRPGAEGQRSEAQLMDFARTYRFDPLGEEAAILYAQRLLERGDLATALAVAEGASQANQRSTLESRGARLAAQALRLLLVDAKGMSLPPGNERLALYWQYEGYATPGERGDDIRRGALRLMLEEGLADAALDVSRQLTPATARQPEAALLIARAEAMAAQGDPQRAMALLRGLPESPGAHRIAAMALGRMGKPFEAAQELQSLRELPDRLLRAEWLFQAQAWLEAANAYAELLRDPALDATKRAEATARLASASALARQRPSVAPELLAPESSATTLLQLSGDTTGPTRGVAAARSAISRSRQIESLLPETGKN